MAKTSELWATDSEDQNSHVSNIMISDTFSESGEIILHLGDTYEFLKSLPSGFAKMIITSPPYNLGKVYENKATMHKYLGLQIKVIDELIRILATDGSICWQVGNFVEDGEVFPLDMFYYRIFKKRGVKLRNRIIWYFRHGLHASLRFSGRYETILWFTKSDNYKFLLDPVRVPSKYPGKTYHKGPNKGQPSGNPLGQNPGDIWDFVVQEWDKELWDIPNVKANHVEKTEHPCQFPIELVERCLLALTEEGDWIVDPYSGAGSSLLAGLKLGRKVVGCDKEAGYINITKERIAAFYEGRLKYRPLGKPVHVPTGKEKVATPPEKWNTLNINNKSKKARNEKDNLVTSSDLWRDDISIEEV